MRRLPALLLTIAAAAAVAACSAGSAPGWTYAPAASGTPVWVVHAEKGDGGLTDAERATLQAAPNVTLVTIPGAGHLSNLEHPEAFGRLVADFLGADHQQR